MTEGWLQPPGPAHWLRGQDVPPGRCTGQTLCRPMTGTMGKSVAFKLCSFGFTVSHVCNDFLNPPRRTRGRARGLSSPDAWTPSGQLQGLAMEPVCHLVFLVVVGFFRCQTTLSERRQEVSREALWGRRRCRGGEGVRAELGRVGVNTTGFLRRRRPRGRRDSGVRASLTPRRHNSFAGRPVAESLNRPVGECFLRRKAFPSRSPQNVFPFE